MSFLLVDIQRIGDQVRQGNFENLQTRYDDIWVRNHEVDFLGIYEYSEFRRSQGND